MENNWYLISGAWSDALIGYYNICKDVEQKGKSKANVVFYGIDLTVVKFLKQQEKIDRVSSLLIDDFDHYIEYLRLSKNDFADFMQKTGLINEIPDLISAHHLELNKSDCSVALQNPDLMESANYKAYQPYLVFHPYSCHSSFFTEHWPYWMAAIDWALETQNVKIFLTGQLMSEIDHRFKFPWLEHPNLMYLVDQTKSMFDVFNMVKYSQGVVTTSSGLSCWSRVLHKPTMVICNKVIKEKDPMKYEWIHSPQNTVFDFQLSWGDFKTEFETWHSKVKD
jgi:hypothetical protein